MSELFRKESNDVKAKLRRELGRKFGIKSRKYQNSIKHLKEVARKYKTELQEKYKSKLKHLKKKYKTETLKEKLAPPEDLELYRKLSVFNQEMFDQVQVESYEVAVIGEITKKRSSDYITSSPLWET